MVLCAALLTPEGVTIANCPALSDISVLLELLDGLGVEIHKHAADRLTLRAMQIRSGFLDTEAYRHLFGRIRGSINLIGPLLARTGYAILPPPGGDQIGARRLDTLLNGLQSLGVAVRRITRSGSFELRYDRLKAEHILLEEASVTGSAAVAMCLALTPSRCSLFHAACEPDVVHLCQLLEAIGVRIEGTGTNRLTIVGTENPRSCHHCIAPDGIEIGSILALAATCAATLTIQCPASLFLEPILRVFRRLGLSICHRDQRLYVTAPRIRKIQTLLDGSLPTISDSIWPGFPTDLLGLALVSAIGANGEALFHQRMYEGRLSFVSQLHSLGAQVILCDPHRALVLGHGPLRHETGGNLRALDIRSGMALLAIALSLPGTWILDGAEHLDRAYQHLDARLQLLGAQIHRLS
jgi:UDP-N-acetylglucosamine 1-carboxyvinyltransferase